VFKLLRYNSNDLNSKLKIDNLDLKILQHLQEDGRMSFREIGRRLDVPHTTVFTRVERLKKKGVIKKFSAIIHPHEQNGQIGVVIVNAPPSESKKIAEEIAKHEEAKKVFRTFDGKIIVKAVVADDGGQKGLEKFLAKLNGHSMQVYHVHDVVKYDHGVHDEIIKAA